MVKHESWMKNFKKDFTISKKWKKNNFSNIFNSCHISVKIANCFFEERKSMKFFIILKSVKNSMDMQNSSIYLEFDFLKSSMVNYFWITIDLKSKKYTKICCCLECIHLQLAFFWLCVVRTFPYNYEIDSNKLFSIFYSIQS